MVLYISASYIFPVTSPPLKNGVIGITPEGLIHEVMTAEQAQLQNVEISFSYEGLLVPGFVNTHCHLELSHLKGKIARHTGLQGFVQQVMQRRAASPDEVEAAMKAADHEMYENGIVAVGDISNKPDSKPVKMVSRLHYHTFIETMGFNPNRAEEIHAAALALKGKLQPLPATIVPHAPYSVSTPLFEQIRNQAIADGGPQSIHNQETADENDFFRAKDGSFLKLYEFLGLNIDFFKASGKTSLQTYLPRLSDQQKTLLVHNTFTSEEDISYAAAIHPELYWCLCPGANLYIENRLPDVRLFVDTGQRVTLGTDSLASNSQLSIVEEMRILQQEYQISLDVLLLWATWNGADFLGIADRFGSLEPGKKPGINLLGCTLADDGFNLSGSVKRLY